MTWTAPAVTRPDPPWVGSEREQLEGWLEYHRLTLRVKCAGLDAEQLRRRAVEPSTLSLLGLIRHLTEVERSWCRRRVAGQDVEYLYCAEGDWDADFDGAGAADAEADYATYLAELDAARAALAGRSLDGTFQHSRWQVEIGVRWVYLHLIEEYARHNGHADLLRERIDGLTGD